jgi:hypothetical protein
MTPPFRAKAGPLASRRLHLPVIAVSGALLVAAYRLVEAVSRYSVNLIFWDQWDFYTPLFNRSSLWQVFFWEHSPHREGIGLVLDKFVLDWTHWNSRAEAFFMVGALLAAAIVALSLKRKLFGSFSYSDIIIPSIFLTLAQMEVLVGEENPSYSVFPELLIGLYCLAWMLQKPIARYATVLVLNFLLIYTGFGIFMGVVTIGGLLFELQRAFRSGPNPRGLTTGAFVLAIASLASFFYHYRWDPSIACHFPDPHVWNYAWFVGLMMAYFLGLRAVLPATLTGVILVTAASAILLWHGVRLWRRQGASPSNLIVVILLSFSLLFAANAAVGRTCFGMPEAAQFSRYMGLLVPAFLAIYFHLLTLQEGTVRTALLWLFVLAVIPGTVCMPNGYSPQIVKDGKLAWKTCILQTGNIDYCDHATGFQVYPNPRRTQLLEKLQFLQKNRLNLYSEEH